MSSGAAPKRRGCGWKKFSSKRKWIDHCLALDVCQKNGSSCTQQDDMAGVLDKMTTAVGSTSLPVRSHEDFRGLASPLSGGWENGVVCAVVAWQTGDIRKSRAMAQAYEMGKHVERLQ